MHQIVAHLISDGSDIQNSNGQHIPQGMMVIKQNASNDLIFLLIFFNSVPQSTGKPGRRYIDEIMDISPNIPALGLKVIMGMN